ncbi:MAG: TonB-dependent receptor, partial [Sulfurimonas sp.]|nr:TonB-dependent receptor [Sulfurimonas sp.]
NSGATAYMTNQLQTSMEGLKLKNDFELGSYKLLVGLDGSKRTWQGEKFMTTVAAGIEGLASESLTPTMTTNTAIFSKLKKTFGDFDFELGGRYDMSIVNPENAAFDSSNYYGINANLLTTYNIDKANKIFLGLGQAYRIPDARELYILGTANSQDLDQTRNREIDLGYEHNNDMMKFKIKGFYSQLSDYIYYNKDLLANNFVNIDATVYGGEISASIYATDDLTIDMGASYKRGQKDEALVGQTDKDLADMAPLRGSVAFNYEYMQDSVATLETQLSDKWDEIDADNGEQELAAWGILNAKIKHAFNKNFDFTFGVNNILDATYAQSNTYVDLTLLSAGIDTMLLNDPGRYVYTNLDFKF